MIKKLKRSIVTLLGGNVEPPMELSNYLRPAQRDVIAAVNKLSIEEAANDLAVEMAYRYEVDVLKLMGVGEDSTEAEKETTKLIRTLCKGFSNLASAKISEDTSSMSDKEKMEYITSSMVYFSRGNEDIEKGYIECATIFNIEMRSLIISKVEEHRGAITDGPVTQATTPSPRGPDERSQLQNYTHPSFKMASSELLSLLSKVKTQKKN